jgi:hypothetical protein
MRLHSYSHFELVCRHIAKQQKGEKEDHMSDLAPFVETVELLLSHPCYLGSLLY